MAEETQDKKIHSRNLSVGLIQGMDRLSPTMIKTIDSILWLIAIFIGLIFLYLVAQILFFMLDISKHGAIDKFEDYQRLLLTFGSLIGAVTGVPFLVWRTIIAQKQNTIAQENIHSTTMAKAIEQLGAMKEEKITLDGIEADGKQKSETATNSKPNIEVRLGAIYLLEKLAREHEQLHWPIMEILCAYVRQNAGPPRIEESNPNDVLRVDIQAAVTVVGRRSHKQHLWEKSLQKKSNRGLQYKLDLSNCHLANCKFSGLDFDYANFAFTCLNSAEFHEFSAYEADFYKCSFLDIKGHRPNFIGAQFREAIFGRSHLIEGYFDGAEFNYVEFKDYFFGSMLSFRGARLAGINFSKFNALLIDFTDANISGNPLSEKSVDLNKLRNLTQDYVEVFWGDKSVKLPNDIVRPINERWVEKYSSDFEFAWMERQSHWKYSAVTEYQRVERFDLKRKFISTFIFKS